jgi:hypothetical protein
MDEITQLLNDQQQAAESRSQCRQALIDDVSAIQAGLKGQTPTQSQLQSIAAKIAKAVENYDKCMRLPRPKLRR